ncbi:MAG TPA: ATP-binding cassette domain-containing protein, partial [Fervidobacterium sp.]|nr:ATP-binding cassette domain-containing protein [Fervidobacterium sp.]
MNKNGQNGNVTVLQVNNLKKYYPSIKAVDDISFDVSAGEIVSILGPNGAGKTTTIEIIEG